MKVSRFRRYAALSLGLVLVGGCGGESNPTSAPPSPAAAPAASGSAAVETKHGAPAVSNASTDSARGGTPPVGK